MNNDSLVCVGRSGQYDDEFYRPYVDGSYRSAAEYVRVLSQYFKPKSVVDFGCGRGAWLKAFRENGAEEVIGLDGKWNSQEKMIDQNIRFIPVNLNRPIELERHYELAISLEVAEHLEQSSAADFVGSVTGAADLVMFGAAYIGQGGTDHINERRHTYWAKLFEERGFRAYDIFRPVIWGCSDVEYWYQQNTFLYVKVGSMIEGVLERFGVKPVVNLSFMDCVHPTLYHYKLLSEQSAGTMIGELVRRVIPKRILPLALRVKRSLR